jgi:hypothetical protein
LAFHSRHVELFVWHLQQRSGRSQKIGSDSYWRVKCPAGLDLLAEEVIPSLKIGKIRLAISPFSNPNLSQRAAARKTLYCLLGLFRTPHVTSPTACLLVEEVQASQGDADGNGFSR